MIEPGRFVITGLGVASPAGCDPEAVWTALSAGQPLFREARVFGERAPAVPAGLVPDVDHGIGRRLAKKIDRFSLLALAAAKGALADAGIEPASGLDERVGMIVGNATGGWGFVEPMMYGLCTEGMGAINAYVATAWFPAAPQGEISILLRLAGHSKTVSADRISAGFALRQALRIVRSGRVPFMLAGGAEAPLSALVQSAVIEARGLPGEGGAPLAEGAALVVVESRESALRRGRPIRASIEAAESGPTLEGAIRRCLDAARRRPEDVDLVILGGAADPGAAGEELASLRAVFGAGGGVRASAPAALYGDSLGAGMALDVVSACLCLTRQAALPGATGALAAGDKAGFLRCVTGAPEPCRLRRVLVNGIDHDGRGFALLLGEGGGDNAT